METSHDDMARAYPAVHDTEKVRLLGPVGGTDAEIRVWISTSSLSFPCSYLSNVAGRSKRLTMLPC